MGVFMIFSKFLSKKVIKHMLLCIFAFWHVLFAEQIEVVNFESEDKQVIISEQTLEETLKSLNFLIKEIDNLKAAKEAVDNSSSEEEKEVRQSIFLSILKKVQNGFIFIVDKADKICTKKFLISLILILGPVVSIYGKYINPKFFPWITNLISKKAGEGAAEIAMQTTVGVVQGALIGTWKNVWAIPNAAINFYSYIKKDIYIGYEKMDKFVEEMIYGPGNYY
ncbi:MAG: hypothetical protein SZ59_C0001G0089 [candidate division TM6 bacterium GW2011_GWF2_28_16]|nr:MAG: hypothetical protein SZ59_C0001G0089 [candidate division TM6 bacterium GW2011_GWF2_28_16]